MKILGYIGGVLAVVVPAIGTVWYFAAHEAFAQEEAKKQRSIEQAVQVLVDIREKEATAKEAEERLRKKLCDEGKLDGEDCD